MYLSQADFQLLITPFLKGELTLDIPQGWRSGFCFQNLEECIGEMALVPCQPWYPELYFKRRDENAAEVLASLRDAKFDSKNVRKIQKS